jgi:hypothetical protein
MDGLTDIGRRVSPGGVSRYDRSLPWREDPPGVGARWLRPSRMHAEHETDDVAPHRPRNRLSSESKLRRGGRHCPVCLSPLAKIAGRTRLMRSCSACGAHPDADKRCLRCHATGRIWEGKRGAACQACGMHGAKSAVIAPATP